MQQPIITIDLENQYSSEIFQQALVKRYDCIDSSALFPADLTPRIYLWVSPSYHLVYRRKATKQPFDTLHKRTADTYEITVHVPDIDASKYNTAIVVPKNNLILGCYFPGYKCIGLAKEVLFEATSNQIDPKKLMIDGNDLLLNRNKFCGIEEVYSRDYVVAVSVIDFEYLPYKSIFEKYLTPAEIHKHRRTITGLLDEDADFKKEQFIADVANLFKEKLEKI